MPTDPSQNPPRCPKCNAPVTPQDKFCGNCSAKIESPRICGSCGAPVAEGMKFCENCGASQVPQAPPTAPVEVPPATAPAPKTPPAMPATAAPAETAVAPGPTQPGGTPGPDKKLLIAGIVGAVVIIAIAFLVVLPMFSGAGSGTSALTGTASVGSAATTASATNTGTLTPGPTQTIPSKYTVLLEVDKDKISGDTSVRAVGSDLGVVKEIQVTLYEQNGETVTGSFVPHTKTNTITLHGSIKPERVQVTVVFYSGEQYTPIDKVY